MPLKVQGPDSFVNMKSVIGQPEDNNRISEIASEDYATSVRTHSDVSGLTGYASAHP